MAELNSFDNAQRSVALPITSNSSRAARPRLLYWLAYCAAIALVLGGYWWLATSAFTQGRAAGEAHAKCVAAPYALGSRPDCVEARR